MQSVLLLLGTVGFSYLLNKILLRFSKNFGVDSRQTQQNWVRWSTAAKPTTGGISFYITFLLGMLMLLIVRPELTATSSPYLALLLSATMAFLVGFADDAYGTHPSLKFLGQLMCGAILLYFGIRIHFFEMVNPNLWIMDYALTMFWVVGIMNSLNMLDNMDGVTTTIATSIAVIGLIMITSLEGLSNIFYAVIAVIGGFVGFLFWNWKPAKIYMGDTGSMFVGMILAFVGIEYFWNIPASPDNISHIRKGLIPLMVFLVPIMDTSFVTFARIARGGSPFVGGKDHLTHHLVHIGVPEAGVPLLLGAISLISGGLTILVYKLIPEWSEFYSLLFGIYPVMLFALFTYLYRRGAKLSRLKDLMSERDKLREERRSQAEQEAARILSSPAH